MLEIEQKENKSRKKVEKKRNEKKLSPLSVILSQIRYLLVVILELNNVSEVQYKGMMTDR